MFLLNNEKDITKCLLAFNEFAKKKAKAFFSLKTLMNFYIMIGDTLGYREPPVEKSCFNNVCFQESTYSVQKFNYFYRVSSKINVINGVQ